MSTIAPSFSDCCAATHFTNERVGILDTIGQTPLVRLDRFLDEPSIALYAKLEFANPGGSAKDRPALAMLRQAIDEGKITRRTTVVESSSGNMGIGLSQVCRYLGLRFICVVDERAKHKTWPSCGRGRRD